MGIIPFNYVHLRFSSKLSMEQNMLSNTGVQKGVVVLLEWTQAVSVIELKQFRYFRLTLNNPLIFYLKLWW